MAIKFRLGKNSRQPAEIYDILLNIILIQILIMTSEPSSWTDLIGKSVYTSDGEDIGDIEAVNPHFMVVKRGIIKVRRYYIPLGKVEGWDGKAVWLNIAEEQAKSNYERDVAPDPYSYHYSSAPTVDSFTRNFQINMPKILPKHEQEERPFIDARKETEEQQTFVCDLCGMHFTNDEELGSHVTASH